MRANELALDTEPARAKVNLSLHVTGRRPDGYHMLDSVVVFPATGDVLTVEPSASLSLTIDGPFSDTLAANGENLVLRAAERLRPAGRGAALHLTKNLPVASGIGGGSADAGAALRLLSRHWSVPLPDPQAVLALGADVPVCLRSEPVRMRGVGDALSVLPPLPAFWIVLVNPGRPVETGAVFSKLSSAMNPAAAAPPARFGSARDFFAWLSALRNDLEAPAIALCPEIATCIEALRGAEGCALARMSGSGATSFGLFETEARALDAAATLRRRAPQWWVAAAPV